MRVCIDGLGITHFRETGIGTYNYELLNNLFYMYPQPNYYLLWNNVKANFKINKNNKCSFVDLNMNRKSNEYSNLEEFIVSNKIDIYHSPNNGLSIPLNKRCNYISTVHDLMPLCNYNYVDEKYLQKFNEVFPKSIENSDKIIVVSEFIKEQLRNNFDVPEKKIQVIYPGCSKIFSKKNDESSENILNSKYEIDGEYILYTGSIHIRKNLDKLIIAFKNINKVNKNIKLVLVGKNDGKRQAYYLKLMSLIHELDLLNSVKFISKVEYNDMPYLYSKAKCVINLSKYEGFPLSTIEAMACDTPVLCNDESLFKEVLGDAGILVDANDSELLAKKILSSIYDNTYRNYILGKQREQAKKYSWEDNVLKTIDVYESFF